VIPLSPAAERLLRDVRANQRVERLSAGSMWQPTPYVFTTELGEPCDPRNAPRALKAAAKRAGLPSSVADCTHCGTLLLSDAVRWRAAQGGIGSLRSRKRCDHRRHLRARQSRGFAGGASSA
jgi:hypothetical protein